jgi:molecular chaperone GrpE
MSDSPTPQAEPAEPASAQEKSLDQLLAEALARIEEQKDARLRAVAEADNARKRAQADIAAAHKFAVERMAESLLPVMDSLDAALNAAQGAPPAPRDGLASLRDGLELTLKQLQAAFQKASSAEIAPAVGERFDPHLHQAIAAVDAAGVEPNSIVTVMRKGYRLHDRVLRPALVTVAQALENRQGNPTSDSNLNTN